MSSETSPVRTVLLRYLEGREAAAQVVTTVAASYYGGARDMRARLRPVLEVIERAAPGTVALEGAGDGAGFTIRAGGRAFPSAYEPELRAAVEAVLHEWRAGGTDPAPGDGFFARLARAIRRLLSRDG